MIRHHMKVDDQRIAGFSLIEMMIAIVIGIILSIGLIQVMVAGKTAAQATQGANFMQENARFAMSQLTYSLQMADHWGPTNPDKGQSTAAATAAFNATVTGAGCTNLVSTATTMYATGQNWWTLGTFGISDSSTPETVLGSANCIPDRVAGSDVVVLRYADSSFIQCSNDPCTTTVPAGAVVAGALYVRAMAGRGMVLATGTEITNLASQTYAAPLDARYYESPDHSNQDGLYTFPYRLEIYYLRSCSSPVTNACTAATVDNGNKIPTLWRRRFDNAGAFVLEPVVEGIARFQLEYGLASDNVSSGTIPTRFADVQTYAPASTVGTVAAGTAFNWLKVVSVRVGILAQSDSFNSSGTRGNVGEKALQLTYKVGSNPGATYAPAGDDKLLQHSVFTSLGQLRNRDRG